MPTLIGTTQRLELNQSSRVPVLEQLSGEKLVFWQGLSARVECALFNDTPGATDFVTDITNLDSVNLVVRKNGPNGQILFSHELIASELNANATYSTWQSQTASHFVFQISELDTTQIVPQSNKLPIYFVITAITSDAVPYIAGFGYGEIIDVGFVENPVASDYVLGRTPIVGGKLLTDFDLNGHHFTDSTLVAVQESGSTSIVAGQLNGTVNFLHEKSAPNDLRFEYHYLIIPGSTVEAIVPIVAQPTALGFDFALPAAPDVDCTFYWKVVPKDATEVSVDPTTRYSIFVPTNFLRKAVEAGFYNVEWAECDTSGVIDSTTQYETARELARLANVSLFNPGIVKISSSQVIDSKESWRGGTLIWAGSLAATMLTFDHASSVDFSGVAVDGQGNIDNCVLIDSSQFLNFDFLQITGFRGGKGLEITGDDADSTQIHFRHLNISARDYVNSGVGIACIHLTSKLTGGGRNACHIKFENTKITHDGDTGGLLIGNCDNIEFSSTFIFTPGATVKSVYVVSEAASRPTGIVFTLLEAGNGMELDPALTVNPLACFGYQKDNGQPDPIFNGVPCGPITYSDGRVVIPSLTAKAVTSRATLDTEISSINILEPLYDEIGGLFRSASIGVAGTSVVGNVTGTTIPWASSAVYYFQNMARVLFAVNGATTPFIFQMGALRALLMDENTAVFGKGVRFPIISDSSAISDTVYNSSTQSKMCYKDGDGVVHPLY
jgi:hypothetical protein